MMIGNSTNESQKEELTMFGKCQCGGQKKYDNNRDTEVGGWKWVCIVCGNEGHDLTPEITKNEQRMEAKNLLLG